MHILFNILLSASIISFTVWLSGRNAVLAGFIIALPIATLLTLPLSQAQYQDPAQSVLLARSIFFAIPVSLLFFVPFLLADRLQLGFWPCYGLGILLLIGGYFAHQTLVKIF